VPEVFLEIRGIMGLYIDQRNDTLHRFRAVNFIRSNANRSMIRHASAMAVKVLPRLLTEEVDALLDSI